MSTTMDRLLSVEEARRGVLDAIDGPVGTETIPTTEALGRVLATPVVAAVSLPPWDNSAMDGYAVRAADTAGATDEGPVRLTVTGDVPAGRAATETVQPGAAFRIATGAPVPAGADAVVQVESTTPQDAEAIARRIGVKLALEDFDRLGRNVHTLVNLMPSGKYLMEDFYYAGGLPAVLRELGENALLNKEALTVNGRTIWENNKDAPCWNRDVIFPFKKPFKENTGIAVLRGNLCPDGAIIKPSAATPKLLKHKGRAVVFENIEDFHKRIDDPDLDIDERCVMVLKNCGPKGYPGMAEVGNMPLPP